ncbi:MAG: ribbon-helix-helix protein, CopG family [Candidatus Aminicenantes bacterium]|nr:ribbon-helix-helix protein, CopG family [Candidatus Aminicenantes bacterium]
MASGVWRSSWSSWSSLTNVDHWERIMERLIGSTTRENNAVAKINISMSSAILDEIDQARRDLGLGRSEFLRRAATSLLEALAAERRLEEKRKAVDKAITIQDKIAEKLGDWDVERILRRSRDSRK